VLELESLVVGNENEYDFLYYDALARFECHKGDEEMAQEHFTRALNAATLTFGDAFISFRHLILEGLMQCLEREGAYETFLQLWDGADDNIPAIMDAKERLAALKQG